MKKNLSLILALLLTISILSGCGSDNTATPPAADGSAASGTAASTTESENKPAAESTTESAAEPEEPATESTTEPAAEPEEPATESTTEPAAEPEEPATESTTKPAAEPEEPATEATTEPATEPVHEHKYEKKVTEPTCTQRGYTTYTCACGDSYISDVVEAKGHEYTSEVVPATCEKRGYTVYTCNACGESYKKDNTDPHPNRKVTDHGETEGTQGHYFYIMFECPDCGDEYMYDFGNSYENYAKELRKYGITADPIEHRHEYEETVTPPTCEYWGYTTYTCSCGYSYVVDDVKATGHDYKTTTVEPTEESEGYILYECKNCGDSYKEALND